MEEKKKEKNISLRLFCEDEQYEYFKYISTIECSVTGQYVL